MLPHRLAPFAIGLAALGFVPAQAQDGADLMRTPACAVARRQLDAVLAAGGPRDRMDAVRRQAALQCLGLETPPPPESRSVPPPASLGAIRLRPEPALRPPAALPAAPSAPPPPPPGPTVITTCDATGCWDASGARYNLQGPVLIGPRGVCTRQNGLLNCP